MMLTQAKVPTNWGCGGSPHSHPPHPHPLPWERAAAGGETLPARGALLASSSFVFWERFNGSRCQTCAAASKHDFLLIRRGQQVISSAVPALLLPWQVGLHLPGSSTSLLLSPSPGRQQHPSTAAARDPHPHPFLWVFCCSRAAPHRPGLTEHQCLLPNLCSSPQAP